MKNVRIISTIAVVTLAALITLAVRAAEEGGNGMKVCTDDGSNPDCTTIGQGCGSVFYSQPCTSCVSGNPNDNCVVTGDYIVDVTVFSNGTCAQLPGQNGLTCTDCDVSGPNPTSCNYTSS